MKVLVTGGTGFLGSRLVEELLRENHQVVLLTRRNVSEFPPSPCRIVKWPLETPEEAAVLLECEAVVNLAGAPVAEGRWTDRRRLAIWRSRVEFTNQLVAFLKQSTKLKTFISSSALGFYGNRRSEVLTESSHVGEGFLADVCQDWELAATRASQSGVRVVLLRTGLVLGRGAGMLAKVEPVFRNGLGAVLGDGQQYMGWIHEQDWINAALYCLNHEELNGPVNIIAPQPVNNASFTSLLARLFKQRFTFHAPAFVLRSILGEMSSLLLDGQNARPDVLEKSGFRFQFPYLPEALSDIFEFEDHGRNVHGYFAKSTWIPAPLEIVFAFFANEKNLERLMPADWNFQLDKKSTTQISSGTLIDYKMKWHRIPMQWRASIEHWDPPYTFVDRQTRGPFHYWHHTHEFESIGGGTLIKDRIHYSPIGGRATMLFLDPMIRRNLVGVFNYREKVLRVLLTR